MLISELKKKVSDIENIELNANNVTMQDGSNVESTIANVKDRVEEVFQYANNGKKLIAAAIGENASSSDTFETLAIKIGQKKPIFTE